MRPDSNVAGRGCEEYSMFLIPVERDNPIRHRPYVVYTLLIVNALAAAATLAFGPETVYGNLGFIPADPTWADTVTSMFLHGHFWHLAGNMFFLWMFGDNVEDVLGSTMFTATYLLSGVAAVGLHLVMSPGSDIPLIGASGAISGTLGLYVAFFPKVPTDLSLVILRWEVKTFRVLATGAVGVWFAQQLLFGWVTTATGADEVVGIAFWAHIGGFVAGLLIGVTLVRFGCMRRYAAPDPNRHPLLGYLCLRSGDTRPKRPDPALPVEIPIDHAR
jgi:membrane associated rhomboid family serine protease